MKPRSLPHDPAAEQGVVGVLLVHPDLYYDLTALGLGPEHFSAPKWGAAYAAIERLAASGEHIDTVTVSAVLDAREGPRPDPDELIAAMAEVPSLGHVSAYARSVIGCARVRSVAAAAAAILDEAYEPATRADPEAFADRAEQIVFAATRRDELGYEIGTDLDALLAEAIADIREGHRGLLTGFAEFDRMTGGLGPGQLLVLGGRPSMSKSAWVLDVARNVAQQSLPVVVFSAEMGRLEIAKRLVAGGGVPSDRILSGQLDDIDLQRLDRRREELSGLRLFIDDTAGMTLGHIRSFTRRESALRGLGLVVVDYIQLIQVERAERRELEVAEISRGLKALARELEVPVIAVAQLNRAVELRKDRRPLMADLRDSGQIEQDADIVCLLHRPGFYDLSADQGLAELIVAKHRNGPTGTIRLAWLSHRMSFANAAGSRAF